MTGKVAVLVPWRSDGGLRERAWEFLRSTYWAELENRVKVFTADSGEGSFSRAKAINQAAADAGDWETAIIADADTFVPSNTLRYAIQATVHTGTTILPFTTWRSITREATRELIASAKLPAPDHVFPWAAERPESLAVSGAVVISRRTWDAVGGMDEAFVNYGWEDRAFMRALTLAGPYRRYPGPAWHLWHRRDHEFAAGPPAADDPQMKRFNRYLQARDLPELTEILGQ